MLNKSLHVISQLQKDVKGSPCANCCWTTVFKQNPLQNHGKTCTKYCEKCKTNMTVKPVRPTPRGLIHSLPSLSLKQHTLGCFSQCACWMIMVMNTSCSFHSKQCRCHTPGRRNTDSATCLLFQLIAVLLEMAEKVLRLQGTQVGFLTPWLICCSVFSNHDHAKSDRITRQRHYVLTLMTMQRVIESLDSVTMYSPSWPCKEWLNH